MAAPRHLYVVTGSSRGLGAALAARLLGPGHTVLGLARRMNEGLVAPAGAALDQWAVDLADPAPVAARLEGWLESFAPADFASAHLINNAGVLSRVGPIDETGSADLANAIRVGLEAPLVLTAAFLRATRSWTGTRRVLNISSGLGRRPMAGSASYCAAKAGLDLLTRSIALDEAERPNGARLVSLAPGVVDTDMQVQLRDSDPSGFPDHQRFVGLKEDGQLVAADDTAARIVTLLHRADFGDTVIADVRD